MDQAGEIWEVYPHWGLILISCLAWVLFIQQRKIRLNHPAAISTWWVGLTFIIALSSSISAILKLNAFSLTLAERTIVVMDPWTWLLLALFTLVLFKHGVVRRSLELIPYEAKNALIQEQLLMESVSQTQRVLSLQEKVRDVQRLNLKSQMNPHFLFNILTGIQHLLMRQDSEKASLVFHKFRKLLMLGFMSHDRIIGAIQDEIDHVTQYLDLENDRIKKKLTIEWRIDPHVIIETTPCPLFILQPLVENAIWHGLEGIAKEPRIAITIQWQEEDLVIMVHDNGRGFAKKRKSDQESMHKKHASRGTQIVRERLQLLRHPGTIEITEKHRHHPFDSGVTSKLHLPLWALEPPMLPIEKKQAS